MKCKLILASVALLAFTGAYERRVRCSPRCTRRKCTPAGSRRAARRSLRFDEDHSGLPPTDTRGFMLPGLKTR